MSKENKHNQQADSDKEQTSPSEEQPDTSNEQTRAETAAASENLEQEIEDLKQRLQRLGADYQNFQKRSLRQIEQAAQMAREEIARTLLPVLDNFEHTLNADHAGQDTAKILEGVQIVYDHLLNVLAGHGCKPIPVQTGDAFDPAQHEALMKVEHDELPENAVVAELARGYAMNERTLRPAKVSVAKPPAANEQPE